LIKGFIFDFDGLILDTEVPEFEVWQQIFNSMGAKLAFEKWARIVGTSSDVFDVISDLEDQIGRKIDREKINAFHHSESLQRIVKKDPQPGIVDYLNAAPGMGLKLGLASSSKRQWIQDHLNRLGLQDRFECICVAEDVEKVKPAPDLYALAMRKLGLKPEESIAFEDSPNGILAAKTAHMYCVAIPNAFTRLLDLSKADIILDSLADMDIHHLLAEFNGNTRTLNRKILVSQLQQEL
jgi:HAD superfamily hydrolase (TIGR01509 family)